MDINQIIDGKKEGYWEQSYHGEPDENPILLHRGTFKNNIVHGYWEIFYTNGNKMSEGSYTNGIKIGLWSYYSRDIKNNITKLHFYVRD